MLQVIGHKLHLQALAGSALTSIFFPLVQDPRPQIQTSRHARPSLSIGLMALGSHCRVFSFGVLGLKSERATTSELGPHQMTESLLFLLLTAAGC